MSYEVTFVRTTERREVGTIFGPREYSAKTVDKVAVETIEDLIALRLKFRKDPAFKFMDNLEHWLLKLGVSVAKQKRGRKPKNADYQVPTHAQLSK